MAGHELMLGFEWLYGVLSGDTTLLSYATGGVWRAYAPPATVPPYVIMGHQSSQDVTTMNAFRLMTSALYQVKIVGPASNMTPLVNGAERIDQLIGLTSGVVTNGVILASYREQPLEVPELVNGELWENIGGLYRLQVEQSQ